MKNKVLIICFSVLLVISIGCTVIGYIQNENKIEEETEKTLLCSDYVRRGVLVDEVQKLASDARITVNIEEKIYNEEAYGTILYQSCNPGTTLKSGETLSVKISRGPDRTSEPKPVYNNYEYDNDYEDNEEEFEEDEEVKYAPNVETIGILFEGLSLGADLKFEKEVNTSDGKVFVEKDKIVYQDFHINNKKHSIDAKGVVSAAIQCDCGYCTGIYYINSKQELYYVDLDAEDINDDESGKIADNMKEMANSYDSIYASTCDSNNIIIKDMNDKLYIYERSDSNKLTPLSDVERVFLVLAGIEKSNEISVSDDSIWDRMIYAVSENAKVDVYMLNSDNKKISAQVVIFNEDDDDYSMYIIDNNNYIYVYDDYRYNNVGKKYKETKVKSFTKGDKELKITYEDGNEETIKGDIFVK